MRTFPIQSRWVPRSTINVVYASQPLCSLPWRQLIPPNAPHQSPALRQVLPLLPFVGIGHQHFPKVKSCSWAQTSLSCSISSSLFCTAHYRRRENTNCISSLDSMKAEFISKDRFHCSHPATKSFQEELSQCVSHLACKLVSSLLRCIQTSVQHCPMHPLR